MKIQCPDCNNVHTYDDNNIPDAGTDAKCKRCGKNFFVKKDARIIYKIGNIYDRPDEIHGNFGGCPQKGISSSRDYPYIFLFWSEDAINNRYMDGPTADGHFTYTGEGQTGDMQFKGGNKAIRYHQQYHNQLHLFKKVRTRKYEYIGEYVLIYYNYDRGIDSKDRDRRIIQFILKNL